MSEHSTIIRIASWIGRSIASSGAIFEDFSTEFLGVDIPSSVTEKAGVQNALRIGKKVTEDLSAAVTDLENLPADASAGEITAKFIVFANQLREYFVSIDTLINALESAIASSSLSGDAATAAGDLKDRFRKVFADYIVVTSIEFITPQLLLILKILGLVDWQRTKLPEGFVDDGVSTSYVKKELQLHKFKNLISDPGNHFIDTIGWGHPDFDPTPFFRIFTEFLRDEEIFSLDEIDGDPILSYGIFSIRRQSSETPPALELTLTGDLEKTETLSRNLNDALRFNLEAGFGYEGGATVLIKPPLDVIFTPNLGELSGRLKMYIDRQESARPFNIINAGSFLLSADNTPFGIGLEADWDINSGFASINPLVFAEISKGNIEIDTSDGDSFVASLLSGAKINGNFDVGFEWSGRDGLRIKGSGGIEIMLPLHVNLGIIEINNLYVALNIKDTGTLSLETSAAFTGNFGPLSAVVERLGVLTNLNFAENNESDTGMFNIDLDFKPPSGVGLSLDAGIVKGGGYLYFDFDREEYAGALELVFSEWIALKAIGLITTKMPDGSKGFSLLIIITVEFGTGIQLGFGFTLLGVGGILGLHRIVKIEPLKDGIRTGAIESVMFPEDVVANAPRIISDLRKFFPPQQDIFLVGPMAKIGWGTPTLLSAQLGVILEFPSVNITILGVIKVILPDEKADILRLQVNFIGRLEPSNKLLWFYAELFDSRVLFITLEGGFGLLVNWGDNANFVVSVGGFHPRYNPPPLPFPEPPRIAANILNESWAKVRIEGYFAVTSNSVQFGARAELYFGLSAFRIEGHLSFDALFQFNPFFFSFSLSFSLSVKVFGIGLWSVGFSGLLEGPTPWHIKGKGSISLLFFSISVPFEHTWGDKKDTKLDPIEVYPLLEKEFKALTNWEARIPDSSNLLVSLRKLGEGASDQLVLHPVGKLRISQRKVPVNFKLDKMGNQRPSDYNKFSVDAVLSGGGNLSVSDTEEKFAIGQFKDLDGSKQMSSPAFEPLDSGIDIGVAGEQMKTSRAVRRVIRYETNIIDNNYKSYVITFFNFFAAGYAVLNDFLFRHFLKGSAVSKSVLSKQHKKRMQPFDEVIQIKPNQYSVVYNTDNKPMDAGSAQFTSQAKALAYMEEQIQNDSTLANRLQVIPNTELNGTA
jgi:hypothetical protein